MLVAVCTLRSAIEPEHTLLPVYREPASAMVVVLESLGREEGGLGGRQNKLCPVFVPASALGGVADVGGLGTCVVGELVAL